MSISEKLTEIAQNTEKVYQAGEKKQYDEFWDTFQDNGNRTEYDYSFRMKSWNDKIFKPKYKMYPTSASYMFANSEIVDFDLENYIDFSNCTTINGAFSWSKFKKLPILNFTKVTSKSSANSLFAAMGNLERIEKIIINNEGSFPFEASVFNSNYKLKEIRFEGVIGISFYIAHSSQLSKDSIVNIFSVLSSSTEGRSATFSKTAVNKAFKTSDTTNDGASSAEWEELVAMKPNWTISLI